MIPKDLKARVKFTPDTVNEEALKFYWETCSKLQKARYEERMDRDREFFGMFKTLMLAVILGAGVILMVALINWP